MEINTANLKNIINNYKNLNDDEKKQLHKYISNVWGGIYSEYYELCNADKELRQIYSKLKEIQNIIKFDWKYYYFKLDLDNANSLDDMYVFDKEKYDYEKNIYENAGVVNIELINKKQVLKGLIHELNADINDSKKNHGYYSPKLIEDINKQIQKLYNEIDNIDKTILKNEKIADHFCELKTKEDEKKFYLDNYESQIMPIYNRYKERFNELASVVIEKNIKKQPIILCCEQPQYNNSQNNERYIVQVLTDVFKSVRDFLLLKDNANREI